MSDECIRVRFAPSPTGYLHVGNARTALFNWLFARQRRGTFVLRVEDTDQERSSSEYERKLVQDLRWLGLEWDEGPDVGGPFGPYRQSSRLDVYAEHTQRLLDSGAAYRCFCSPEELEQERQKALAAGKTPVYSGRCRSLTAEDARARVEGGEAASLRLRTPGRGQLVVPDLVRGDVSFDLALVGDPVLVRSTGLPAYNYVVVVDDHLMRISHVIRGEDHLANTVRQILIYRAFAYTPPRFAHLSMVMGKDKTRLSKRHGATAVDQFDRDGILAAALFNYLALLGWAPPQGEKEVLDADNLVRLFDLSKVSRSAAIFDYGKLFWLNRQHLQRLPTPARVGKALPHLREAGLMPADPSRDQWQWLEGAVDIFAERVDTFSQMVEGMSQLFDFSPEALADEDRADLESECGARVLRSFARRLGDIETLDYSAFAEMTKAIKTETGCKGRELYHPLRVALTGRGSGLDLDKFIPLVETGSKLGFPRPLKNCGSRIEETLTFLER
jgi:nondiscriminating glutamyl-tRNA synthetase